MGAKAVNLPVSAKITLIDLDGSEYQFKKKAIANYLKPFELRGFAKREATGIWRMLVRLVYAMRMLDDSCDGGQLNAPRGPEGLLLYYPIKDQRTFA